MELLVDLLVIWAVWWFVRRARHPYHRYPPHDLHGAPQRRVRAAGDMVACIHCGLYIPRAEALSGARGTHYCCPEHRDAAARG